MHLIHTPSDFKVTLCISRFQTLFDMTKSQDPLDVLLEYITMVGDYVSCICVVSSNRGHVGGTRL
jgi:hypothetical protein